MKTISVKREGRRWYVILACDEVPSQPLPATGVVVGIDMGVASFLTTSDGEHIANPRHLAASGDRLATAQRALARCKRGSARRRKVRDRVAAIHRKVRSQRLDFAHKTANRLVADHDLIAHEDLRIGNMTRSASGTLDQPGVNVAAKSGLNRSLLDAGWGMFLRVLASKAESAGRDVVAVNPHQHLPHLPHMWAPCSGEPCHPSQLLLRVLRVHRARRRRRRHEHSQGRACPSRRRGGGLARSRCLQASEESRVEVQHQSRGEAAAANRRDRPARGDHVNAGRTTPAARSWRRPRPRNPRE